MFVLCIFIVKTKGDSDLITKSFIHIARTSIHRDKWPKAKNLVDTMIKMCDSDAKLDSEKLNRILGRSKLKCCMDSHNRNNTVGIFRQIKHSTHVNFAFCCLTEPE